MPLFTVAIPTYNRAHLLPYTLSCLQQQTYRDFEVVISDNASTDNTETVIAGFCDLRIRYFRQPSFLCATDNWAACADLAHSEWIVFNQDDDVLSPYFLERCAHAIQAAPKIVMYATEFTCAKDITRNQGAINSGFPFLHCWDRPQPRLIPGVQMAALSWFTSPFSPPAQAIPTHLFRKHWPRGPAAASLGEHYLNSHVVCEGMVAFEAYNGAIIRNHADRASNTTTEGERRRVGVMLVALGALFQENKLDWQRALREILLEAPLAYRESILNDSLFNEFIAPEAMEILATSVATEKGVSPINYVADLRAERLKPPPVGRFDRWKIPKPVARVMRGLLYAAGKDYA